MTGTARQAKSKPQRHIDAENLIESRRTWQPDWEELDRMAAEIDRARAAKRRGKRK